MPNFENHPLYPGNNVPLFIAPGVLKDEAQLNPFFEIEDPRIIPTLCIGGFTSQYWPGNAKAGEDDFVYYPDLRMAGNARGLPNLGATGLLALKDTIAALTDKGIKTVVQVTNLPHEKPAEVIPRMLRDVKIVKPTAWEVNLSCPNGLDENGNLHPPTCNDPYVSSQVMERSRDELGADICLGAKDSPHASLLESGVDEAGVTNLIASTERYIDFLVGINTVGGQEFPEITCAGGKGGMSGPVVAPLAKQWLKIARKALRSDVPILSCGGVDSENAEVEVSERLSTGAMLVGGAQEFHRAAKPDQLALRWSMECI